MKLTKKVTQCGNSLAVILDKPILDRLKINKGDLIELEIKVIKDGK